MQLGYSCDISHLPELESAGIPFIELTVPAVRSWTDEEYAANKAKLESSPVRCISCNCLIGGFSLYDDEGFVKTRAYLDETLPKLAGLGIRTLVFGSGGYRRVPEGVSPDFAKERILDFLRLLSAEIAKYDMVCVIEPLNKKECNILNTAKEAAWYVRKLCLPNIRLLVDFYHFLLEDENLKDIASWRGLLYHTHIANPATRFVPTEGDGCNYPSMLKALETAGYDGLVVCECRTRGDFAADTLSFKTQLGF